MQGVLEEILKNSCLTKIQLYTFLIKKGSLTGLSKDDVDVMNSIKARPSGEVSTIRAQARRNIKSAIYTLVILRATGALGEEELRGVLELGAEVNRLLSLAPELSEGELSEIMEALESAVSSMLF